MSTLKQAKRFAVQPGWRLLMGDMGLSVTDVLRTAGLPDDLFQRQDAWISADDYFQLWRALETVTGDATLPINIGQSITVESFDPPIFASLCSANLTQALQRLAAFKRLVGPIHLQLQETPEGLQVDLSCYGYSGTLPRSLAASEVVFMTQLARLATRSQLSPVSVTVPEAPVAQDTLETYLGCSVRTGKGVQLVFANADAKRPFLTENEAMWQYFEPELRRRLSQLDADASMAERVRALLLELLPSGQTSMTAVASRLAMSGRTLQRRLQAEGHAFADILQAVRLQLAQHYLADDARSQAETAYLLGFKDANSFVRAFHDWTGQTPGQYRHPS